MLPFSIHSSVHAAIARTQGETGSGRLQPVETQRRHPTGAHPLLRARVHRRAEGVSASRGSSVRGRLPLESQMCSNQICRSMTTPSRSPRGQSADRGAVSHMVPRRNARLVGERAAAVVGPGARSRWSSEVGQSCRSSSGERGLIIVTCRCHSSFVERSPNGESD
jgi:hypothetical protein